MQPSQLKAADFNSFRPIARKIAVQYLPTLQQLPLAFLPFLIKEMNSLDWQFPAEREDLVQQLSYLAALPASDRAREMGPFSQLRLAPEMQAFDWVNLPGQFLEKLSAYLWASAQMDTFRQASEAYMRNFRGLHPDQPPPVPRVAVVLIGNGVGTAQSPLFKKLRRQGTYFGNVDADRGTEQVMQLLESRASKHAMPYGHWLIDGGAASVSDAAVVSISYQQLSAVRTALTARIRRAFEARTSPEALRTTLAKTTPAELGMSTGQQDDILDRFKVALFTEGSGTQIYSTTFVQWTAREALRRAKPVTVVARFTPRQREAPMNELLNGNFKNTSDPAGSLVDADMGAWYTWISLQRLPGAAQSSFLAWFEGHNQAVAVGPGFAKAAEDNAPIRMADLLDRLSGAPVTARV